MNNKFVNIFVILYQYAIQYPWKTNSHQSDKLLIIKEEVVCECVKVLHNRCFCFGWRKKPQKV